MTGTSITPLRKADGNGKLYTRLSEAGRKLFGATREKRKIQNDADRLRKYLARFNLDWQTCRG